MTLRSQNKRMIIEISTLRIQRVLGGRNKAALYASKLTSIEDISLGVFESEERAMKELDFMQDFFSQYPERIYQIKPSKCKEEIEEL